MHAWTWMEPADGVMNRLLCGRSSDGRSLHIAGMLQLGRVEGRDSRRTGPSRTKIQDATLRLVTQLCQQTTVAELFRNDLLLSFKGL